MGSATPSFGIIIASYPGVLWLTKSCLSSIKTYAPKIPVAIIADQNLNVRELERLYNIQYVIHRDDVRHPFLREKCFGSRYTAAVGLFESPFENYLYVDADTIFWGDITGDIQQALAEYDFIHNTPHEEYSEFIYKTQYFDYERIFQYFPEFPWRDCHFFNGGVFAGRRDVLDLDLFIYLYNTWLADKTLIFEIQGIINFLVFYQAYSSTLKIKELPLQEVIAVRNPESLRNEYRFEDGIPVIHKNIVLHYAGIKPMLKSYKGFLEPVVYFRMKHLRESGSPLRYLGKLALVLEEYNTNLNTYYQGSLYKYLKYKITGRK